MLSKVIHRSVGQSLYRHLFINLTAFIRFVPIFYLFFFFTSYIFRILLIIVDYKKK